MRQAWAPLTGRPGFLWIADTTTGIKSALLGRDGKYRHGFVWENGFTIMLPLP